MREPLVLPTLLTLAGTRVKSLQSVHNETASLVLNRRTVVQVQETPNCLWRVSDITRNGLKKLGYDSFEAMWADYTVLALVRNPYDRAGSSYDYTLGRRTVRPRTQWRRLWTANCRGTWTYLLGIGGEFVGASEPLQYFACYNEFAILVGQCESSVLHWFAVLLWLCFSCTTQSLASPSRSLCCARCVAVLSSFSPQASCTHIGAGLCAESIRGLPRPNVRALHSQALRNRPSGHAVWVRGPRA